MEATYIGKQLKAARKLREIETTKELEDLVGKPRFGWRVIGKIERNERAVSPHEIDWLAEALNLPSTFFTDPPPPAERQVNGVTVAEAGDTPVAPELSLADALAAFTEAIDAQNALLARQSEILERIERAIDRQDAAATKEAESRQGLLAAADAASQALRDASQRPATKRGKQAT